MKHASALDEAKAGTIGLQSQHDTAVKELEAQHASVLEETKAARSNVVSDLKAQHEVCNSQSRFHRYSRSI